VRDGGTQIKPTGNLGLKVKARQLRMFGLAPNGPMKKPPRGGFSEFSYQDLIRPPAARFPFPAPTEQT
jgi:hypothetical protein